MFPSGFVDESVSENKKNVTEIWSIIKDNEKIDDYYTNRSSTLNLISEDCSRMVKRL